MTLVPANDLSPWNRGETRQRRCDCGSWTFELMLLDERAPRLICSRCEMDHTEACFPIYRER